MNTKVVKRLFQAEKAIKTFLKMDVKCEQMMLVDGVTTIEADMFEPDFEVYVVVPDGENQPLPAGEYEVQDGRMLTVVEDGVIASIEMPPASEEQAPEEQATPETPVEASAPVAPQPKKVVTTTEHHFSKEEVEALQAEIVALKAELEAVKLSAVPTPVEVVTPIVPNPEPKARPIAKPMQAMTIEQRVAQIINS